MKNKNFSEVKAIFFPGSNRIEEHLFVASDDRPLGNSGFSAAPVLVDGAPALWLNAVLQDIDESRTTTFSINSGLSTCFEASGGVFLDRRRLEHIKKAVDYMLAVVSDEEETRRFIKRAVDIENEAVRPGYRTVRIN